MALTVVGIVLLSGFVNLMVGSASAKWALIGAIMVPMLMQLGVSPDLTQAAYRVGDSSTNIITPLMPYFPLIVVFCQRYVKASGIGTLLALMLPFSITLLVLWTGSCCCSGSPGSRWAWARPTATPPADRPPSPPYPDTAASRGRVHFGAGLVGISDINGVASVSIRKRMSGVLLKVCRWLADGRCGLPSGHRSPLVRASCPESGRWPSMASLTRCPAVSPQLAGTTIVASPFNPKSRPAMSGAASGGLGFAEQQTWMSAPRLTPWMA
jgi:hypothetical protein